MKITNVKCKLYSYKLPKSEVFTDDYGTCVQVNATIVEVETDEGITGYGEVNYSDQVCKTIVETQLKPMLIKEDPLKIAYLWEKMYTGTRLKFTVEQGHTAPIYARRGETIYAISGVDIALWDIMGKYFNQPVYKLLGAGGYRKKLRCYASHGPSTLNPEEVAKQALSFTEQGFTAFKMRWGLSENDVERVAAVREAVGPRVDIMLDAHGCMDPVTAIRMAYKIEKYDITWIEEPVSPDDKDGMADVRNRIKIPIAAGESECTRYPFLELLKKNAIDIVQADPTMVGGLTESYRIALMANNWNKRFVAHTWGAGISFVASIHLTCAIPNGYLLEYPGINLPFMHSIFKNPIKPEDGYITVPEKPGLGFELDEEELKKYPYHRVETSIGPQVRKI